MIPKPAGLHHQQVRRLRRLARDRAFRQHEQAFILEGEKLVSTALDKDLTVEAIFCSGEPALLDRVIESKIPVYEIDDKTLAKVSTTVSPQPVMAIVPLTTTPIDAFQDAGFVLVCESMNDPGNAGTLIRSADAAGADGVIFCDNSVDVFSPKAVRASAGSVLNLKVSQDAQAVDVLAAFGDWGFRRVAAVAHGGGPHDQADLRGKVVFVLGSESHGIDPKFDAVVDEKITIPISGDAESLNVAMAGSVLCFEAARQRNGNNIARQDGPG